MSSNSHPNASSSQFQVVFDAALNEYCRKTGKAIDSDPLTIELRTCRSSNEVYEVLQEQAQKFNEFRNGDRVVQIMRKLKPTVDILIKLSNGGVLGEGIGLKFPPAKAIVAGIGILLTAVKDVSTSYDALMDLFECLGNYLRRLGTFTEIPPAMEGMLVSIMVELLGVLALATRQIKQGRFKKFAKKLLGENDIEAVLQRLDRLTMEESRMTVAQTMEVSTQSMEVVRGLFNDMRTVMEDGKTSTDNIQEALVKLQEMVESVDKMRRDDLQQAVRQWLSPPDPSINHNTARDSHHEGTATWFTEGTTYEGWKIRGSFMWLHGKPGSGKSVLCSSIIKDLEATRKAGLASLAYYYFDFKDSGKQNLRGFLSSLLRQLTARSDAFYNILNRLYEACDTGSRQPSENDLVECLMDVLAFPGQSKVYIVVDAMDECPNNSGIPTSREKVLKLIDRLLSLRLPHVRICITSRPEVDIHKSLKHLTSHCVSLHDEGGQRKDIIDYIKHVVNSDTNIQKWREEDKELVIDTLAQKAQGMFRWIYCQLETLRRCFPGSIRRALNGLPRTLDETYERILLGIDDEKWEYALRLFRCLAVARRPLRAYELAEVLAVDLGPGGMPKLNVELRPRDADEAVLSACSTLVAIIGPNTPYPPHVSDTKDSWLVQFSHYSVKEFLTSERLQSSRMQRVSRFHIAPTPAHTILAQSCISTLLQLDDSVDRNDFRGFPLAEYAVRNWVEHAQVEGVASQIRIGMASLFDPELPHFTVWVDFRRDHWNSSRRREPLPLSYASFYGFDDVVKYLVTTRHQGLDEIDPDCSTPLLAAQRGGHFGIAQFLLEHGADVDGRDDTGWTPLGFASRRGQFDFVRLLLEQGANIGGHTIRESPLHEASEHGYLDIVEHLIEFGADVNRTGACSNTPLIIASRNGNGNVVQLLIKRGANVDAWNTFGSTAFQEAVDNGHLDIVQLFLKHGLDINVRNYQGATPLHRASRHGKASITQLLIEEGANVETRDNQGSTPLYTAAEHGHLSVVKVLLSHGADVKARDNLGAPPLHAASLYGRANVVQFFLESGADMKVSDNQGATALHLASRHGHSDIVQTLLGYEVDVNARHCDGSTPMHDASAYGHVDVVQQLINVGTDKLACDNEGASPLHKATFYGNLQVVQLLLQSSVDPNTPHSKCSTPLHQASRRGHAMIVEELLEWGADKDAQDKDGLTPLWEALLHGQAKILELLLERRADVNTRNNSHQTALHLAVFKREIDVVSLLLAYGANPNSQDVCGCTPLHLASTYGHVDIMEVLVDRGADVNSREEHRSTALHLAALGGHTDAARWLVQHGADVNAQDDQGRTPFSAALETGNRRVARLLADEES